MLTQKITYAWDCWLDVIAWVLERTRSFQVFDWAILKLYLLSFGMLIGAAFSDTIKKLRGLLCLLSLFSMIYLVWKIFFIVDEE